jgi:hypothetical protein
MQTHILFILAFVAVAAGFRLQARPQVVRRSPVARNMVPLETASLITAAVSEPSAQETFLGFAFIGKLCPLRGEATVIKKTSEKTTTNI